MRASGHCTYVPKTWYVKMSLEGHIGELIIPKHVPLQSRVAVPGRPDTGPRPTRPGRTIQLEK
eukprot:scaffold2799_cov126-Skeletonema_marinoi.AAC.2